MSVRVQVMHEGGSVTAQGRIQRVILRRGCAIVIVAVRVAVAMTPLEMTVVVFRELRAVMLLVAALIEADRHLEFVRLWNFLD